METIASTFSGMRVLQQTPETLRALLADATDYELKWRPAPDRWSISMVLAHLANVEVNGFVGPLHALAEENHPVLPGYDQLAFFQAGRDFDGRAELETFTRERQRTVQWLGSLAATVSARRGRHEELGELSFDQLLNEFAFHDLGHVRQVMELYRSCVFYPKMGPTQSFYKINP